LVIPEIVFVETVHVLRSYYKHERHVICEKLRGLLNLPGVQTITASMVLKRSLEFHEAVDTSWPDALIAAHAFHGNMPVYSFDSHLDKFACVSKLAP